MSVPFTRDTLRVLSGKSFIYRLCSFARVPHKTLWLNLPRHAQGHSRKSPNVPCTHSGSESSGNQEESPVRKVPPGQQILSGARFLGLDVKRIGTSETAGRKAHLHKRRRGIFPSPSLRNVREGGRQRWKLPSPFKERNAQPSLGRGWWGKV